MDMAARNSSTVLPELSHPTTQQRFRVALNRQTSYVLASGHENNMQGSILGPQSNPRDAFHTTLPADSSMLDDSTISWHTAREQCEDMEPISPKTPPQFELQYQKPSSSAKDSQAFQGACKRARHFARQQSGQVAAGEERQRRTPVKADTTPTKPRLPREPELWESPPPYFGLPSSSGLECVAEQECEARGRARKSPQHEAPGGNDAMETD
ncbi:hypothetical protein AC579_8266 [Pseudocercospora musae]|uniref:Uncharacterized protein n=1 Tax=Pseudocercospora musae TaxID=113226 RepID=A0A139IVI5_9PEZI|nr:hypothetical protein AC579_8266 [Pseudocercospora musae]